VGVVYRTHLPVTHSNSVLIARPAAVTWCKQQRQQIAPGLTELCCSMFRVLVVHVSSVELNTIVIMLSDSCVDPPLAYSPPTAVDINRFVSLQGRAFCAISPSVSIVSFSLWSRYVSSPGSSPGTAVPTGMRSARLLLLLVWRWL